MPEQPPKGAPLGSLDDAQNHLLATVAHEMRTPLTSIMGYADLLAEGSAGALNAEQQAYVRHIAEKSAVLLHLVNQLTAGTRLHGPAPACGAEPEPADLADLCHRALADVTPQARAQRLDLQHRLEDARLPAHIDAYKLRCILTNLLANAVKYTPAGGSVRLSASIRPGPVLHLEVADTGIGMAPEHLERIFETFYRVPGQVRGPGGSGLGLSIVREAVDAMGGRIAVQSRPMHGSVFAVEVPL